MSNVMGKPDQQNISLDTAVSICQAQGKVCLWHTDGLAINYDGTIPKGYLVGRTSILVGHEGSCLVMFICISMSAPKALVVAAGDFSSLDELRTHSPNLFKAIGDLNII